MTAAASLPKSFTLKQREELFNEIVHIYDLADEVLAAVAKEGVTNRAIQAELATPFVTQVTNSANILSAYYTEVVQKGRPITPDLQDTIEGAFRNIFLSLKEFAEKAEHKLPLEASLPVAEPSARIAPISKLAQGIRALPSGSLQSKLNSITSQLHPKEGRDLVEATHLLGDHAAGLATILGSMGLVRPDKAIPVLGHTTPIARGAGLTYDPDKGIQTIPVMLDPRKITNNN